MERPKSSKYNFGRRKTTFFKTETPSDMVNEVEINVVAANEDKLIINEMDSNEIRIKNLKKQRINERHMQIKSAYPTFQSQLRPQSARHNLDKYRQDIQSESKQAKSALKNLSNQAKFIDLADNNELDELDYLYIREEDSTSSENELDTQNKKPIDGQHNIKKQKKFSKLKLLKQRKDVGETNNVNIQNSSSNNNSANNVPVTTITTTTPTAGTTTNNAKNSTIDLTRIYSRSNTVSILKNPLQQQTLNEQLQQQPHQQHILKTSTSNLNKDHLRHQARIQQQNINNQNIPWLSRNRDFSAQKVLLKHRAQLEEITLKNSTNLVNTRNMFLTEKFLRK